ncbi:MAG TPA: hypothetical protein VN723_00730 [Rhizomicrobium sp.]|nr:hypothetical protein [Rhizomicrobium sp.]
MARRRIATWLWLLMAVAMIGAATVLTIYVTTVNGRLPGQTEPVTDFGPPLASFKNGKMEFDQAALEKMKADNEAAEKHPDWQTLAVYARQADAELARKVDVKYFSDRAGDGAWVAFNIPQGAEAKIVLNNVKPGSCQAIRAEPFARPDSMGTGGKLPVTVRQYGGVVGRTYYLVDPGHPDTAFSVSCKLKNIFRRHTFTERSAAFGFEDAQPGMSDFFTHPGSDSWLRGFAPLPSLIVNFSGIDNADHIQFIGGHQDQSLDDFEFSRVLALGQSVHLTWVDIVLEEWRDILLVVIGTLVGLGVTMFIEAIRPAIDGLDELAGDSAAEFPEGEKRSGP